MKLRYRNQTNCLVLNHGPKTIFFDEKNCRFQPVVDLIDQLKPQRIAVYGKITNKSYLNLLRAIFHSKLNQFRLHLFINEKLDWKEDFLYPISKILGETATNVKKRKIGGITDYQFDVKRPDNKFDQEISFYVISDGKDATKLSNTLETIYAQEGGPFRACVVGPDSIGQGETLKRFPACVLISDAEIYGNDLRFPIAKKKNLVLNRDYSKYVVIMHDRFTLPKDWTKKMIASSSFDLYTCPIDGEGYRYMEKIAVNFRGYLSQKKTLYFLSHSEDNSNQFIDGGFLVINRHSLPGPLFDERLHWYEMEDADMILRAKQNCNLITFDNQNKVYSKVTTHFRLNAKSPVEWFLKIYVRRLSVGAFLLRLAHRCRNAVKS